MGHVPPQLGQIVPAEGGGRLGEIGGVFLAHLQPRHLGQAGEVGQAEHRLLLEQPAEIPLVLPQAADAVQHPLHGPVHLPADEAGARRLAGVLALLFPAFAKQGQAGEDLLVQLVQMAFQHQGHPQAVALGEHHLVMREAEPLLVGLDAHVRLHHGRAGDVVHHPGLQHVPHPADGAAVPGFEHLAYRNAGNILSHGFTRLPSPTGKIHSFGNGCFPVY